MPKELTNADGTPLECGLCEIELTEENTCLDHRCNTCRVRLCDSCGESMGSCMECANFECEVF